jgi:hypothetical protein
MAEKPVIYGPMGEKPLYVEGKDYKYDRTFFIIHTKEGFYPAYIDIEDSPVIGPLEKSIDDIHVKRYGKTVKQMDEEAKLL